MLLPIHDIPGRLRFILPALRGDRRAAAILRARIRATAGVSKAEANPITGSLIVQYDDARHTRDRILSIIDGFESGRRRPARAAGSPAGSVADILANAVAERIIERALRAAVAAVI